MPTLTPIIKRAAPQESDTKYPSSLEESNTQSEESSQDMGWQLLNHTNIKTAPDRGGISGGYIRELKKQSRN